jgi:hypothetical protein
MRQNLSSRLFILKDKQSYKLLSAVSTVSPGTRQLVNMNYAVVVRPGIGYCSIVWSQDTDDSYSFTVSEDTDGVAVADLGE